MANGEGIRVGCNRRPAERVVVSCSSLFYLSDHVFRCDADMLLSTLLELPPGSSFQTAGQLDNSSRRKQNACSLQSNVALSDVCYTASDKPGSSANPKIEPIWSCQS